MSFYLSLYLVTVRHLCNASFHTVPNHKMFNLQLNKLQCSRIVLYLQVNINGTISKLNIRTT